MNYKEEIEKLLNLLKAHGYGRRKIEADFEYRPKSIDQILAKNGNPKFLAALKIYCRAVLPKTIYNEESPKPPIKAVQAKGIEGRIDKIEASLLTDRINQEGLLGFVTELLYRDCLREAKGNEEKALKSLGEILRRIAPELHLRWQKNIGADGHKKSMEM